MGFLGSYSALVAFSLPWGQARRWLQVLHMIMGLERLERITSFAQEAVRLMPESPFATLDTQNQTAGAPQTPPRSSQTSDLKGAQKLANRPPSRRKSARVSPTHVLPITLNS